MVTIDVGLLVLRPQITSIKESKKQFDCNEKKKNQIVSVIFSKKYHNKYAIPFCISYHRFSNHTLVSLVYSLLKCYCFP